MLLIPCDPQEGRVNPFCTFTDFDAFDSHYFFYTFFIQGLSRGSARGAGGHDSDLPLDFIRLLLSSL